MRHEIAAPVLSAIWRYWRLVPAGIAKAVIGMVSV
jgi:hypothetical protein